MDFEAELKTWLLDSDPVLRWQVERDLTGAPEAEWEATRARVATEGKPHCPTAPRPARGLLRPST